MEDLDPPYPFSTHLLILLFHRLLQLPILSYLISTMNKLNVTVNIKSKTFMNAKLHRAGVVDEKYRRLVKDPDYVVMIRGILVWSPCRGE